MTMKVPALTASGLALGFALALFGCANVADDEGGNSSDAADETTARQAAGEAKRPIVLAAPPRAPRTREPMEWAGNLTYEADGPHPIAMSDVPAAVYDPFNKLSRGWGLSGPKRMTKRIPAEEADRLRADALRMAPSAGVQSIESVVAAGRSALAPSAGVEFDSLDITDCCGGGTNVPPDPELAVGPDHIIAVVNVAFAIYDKSGNLMQGPVTFSSFFAGTPGCTSGAVFDPNVLYDEEADRFILGIDGDGTDYCVAAATTSDPLGTWNRYGFATDFAGAFFDYPHAGVGIDAIFMGSNQFDGGLPFGFEGRVFAMDKVALYSGGPLTVVTHSTGFDGGTPQPMNLHGFNQGTWPTSGPHYILSEVFDGATHSVWSWEDPFGADIFQFDADLDLNTATGVTAGFPVDAPQMGGSNLQANDWRGLDTEYRNGFIWMTGTIACNPGTGTVDCLRWAQIDPSVPVIVDAGVFSSAGEYRIFPDLAVNHCDDMAIGYTKTSTSMFPSIYVTGRESTDAPGTVQPETELKAGEIAYTAFDGVPRRWGDYTGMTIDPNGQTFWYLGEYSKDTGNPSGRWGTYVGSFEFPSCEDDPPADGLGGSVSGMSVRRVNCRNRTNGDITNAPARATTWDCEDLGLSVSPGDRIQQTIIGKANSGAGPLGGSAVGMRVGRVLCRNQSAGGNVQAQNPGTSWSCEDLGLVVNDGDRVNQTIWGVAE